jgi:hypothetical protein
MNGNLKSAVLLELAWLILEERAYLRREQLRVAHRSRSAPS